MTESPRIVVVGSTMIDLIAYTPRIPSAGETLVGERFDMGFGGKGANQAVMARLLGADVAMVNALGDDLYGDTTLQNFAAYGIDTTHVRRVAGSSGVAPIWVEPDGTNRIIIVPGANQEMTAEQATSAVESFDEVAVVLGQLEIPKPVTAAAFRTARQRGAITVLNPAPADTLDPDLLTATDWLVPNEGEFAALAGAEPTDDALASFAEQAGVRLVVTLGADGAALVADTGEVLRIPAETVSAVDTTGAGDAFVGAFAYGLAAGLGEERALRLGLRCATDSVTRPGTQASFPSEERCRELLAEL